MTKSSSFPPTKEGNPFSRIVFLFGPTGVGKTDFLTRLDPDKFAVINADSIQVYRGLDIGSAKVSADVCAYIHHYLIDVEDPWNRFTVGRFLELADQAVLEIAAAGKIPILCGGTAYYFKHFLYGLSEAPASDPAVRQDVARETEEKGLDWAWHELEKVDPQSAGRIHPNDAYRITRALEVYRSSLRPLSDFKPSNRPRYGMHPLIYGLVRPQAELEQRITQRVEQMFQEGLLAEIRGLMARGAEESWPGMQGIGYREFFSARKEGECSISTIKAEIARNSRLYAKRQMTFFKSFSQVNWLESSASRQRLLLELNAMAHQG